MIPKNVKQKVYELFHGARWHRGQHPLNENDHIACLIITNENDEPHFEPCDLDDMPNEFFVMFFSHVIGTGQGEYILFLADANTIEKPTEKELRKVKRAKETKDMKRLPDRAVMSLTGTLFSADGPEIMLSSTLESCKSLSESYSDVSDLVEDIDTIMLFKDNAKYGWKEHGKEESIGTNFKNWNDFSELVEKSAEMVAENAGVKGWN